MEKIGSSGNRGIYYVHTTGNDEWASALPTDNWCAFTIVTTEGSGCIDSLARISLDSNVSYICSAVELARETELAFDTEIVRRAIDEEAKSGIPADYESVPLTTVHRDLGEGLWFAIAVATTGDDEIDKVVCIDVTSEGVLGQLKSIVNDINNGWLPPD